MTTSCATYSVGLVIENVIVISVFILVVEGYERIKFNSGVPTSSVASLDDGGGALSVGVSGSDGIVSFDGVSGSEGGITSVVFSDSGTKIGEGLRIWAKK